MAADRYQIMLDIETLGKDRGAVVLSVGAVVMDMQELRTVDKQYWVLDLKEQDEQGRSIQADTVMWWMQQSDDARQAFRNLIPKTIGQDFANDIHGLFKKWETTTPWANGVMFDLPILENYLIDFDRMHGHLGGTEMPWGYRWQDMRSLATAMAEALPYAGFSLGTAHNALDDAERQAEYVLACKRWIRERTGWKDEAVTE